MTGRKKCSLQVPPVVPYIAYGNFPKALCGKTGGTCSAHVFPSCHEERSIFQKISLLSTKPPMLGIHPPKPWQVLYFVSPSVMLTVFTNSPSTRSLDVP